MTSTKNFLHEIEQKKAMRPTANFDRFEADIRYAFDLKPVLYQPEMLNENFPAYFMYRDSYRNEKEKEKIRKAGLRFDYTITPPNVIGMEYIKTYGHYHPKAGDLSYPEVYQVLEGEAIFVLQKRKERDDVIESLAVVEINEGEIIIVPPGYGHVMINRTGEKLITSNWVCRDFKSIYEPYTSLRGACYYLTVDGWIKNERYREVPELSFAKNKTKRVLDVKGDMYELVDDLDTLEFLKKPDEYRDVFEDVLDFQ